MRFLMIVTAVLAGLYGGYWFVGAAAAGRAAQALLDGASERGIEVEVSDVSTIGFPSRFDTTLTDLRLTDPGRGLGWDAPFFQVFALSYQPNHVIAVWPDRQDFVLPGMRLTLASDQLRASLRARPAPALPLQEATVEGTGLALSSDTGWQVDVAGVLAALRIASGEDVPADSYDVYAQATAIALPARLREALGGAGLAPEMAERLRLDGRVTLDAPLDRFAGDAAPQITAITLRDLTVQWGAVSLTGSGEVGVDATGRAEGQLTLTVTNWRQLIEMAEAAGMIEHSVAQTMARAASAVSDGAGQLRAPITFRNGFAALGPVPIGPAPRLR